MDNVRMNYYLTKVPIEIRQSIKQLNNDQKWAIFIALTEDDNKTFSELKDEFKANPGELNRVLKSLIAGGLIDKSVNRLSDLGNSKKIHYDSTSHGVTLMNCFFNSLEVHTNIPIAGTPMGLVGYQKAESPLRPIRAKKNELLSSLKTTSNYSKEHFAKLGEA